MPLVQKIEKFLSDDESSVETLHDTIFAYDWHSAVCDRVYAEQFLFVIRS